MVAEITAPKSMGKVLGYNFSKVTAGNASVILTSSMSVDANGETNFERALTDMDMRIPSGIRTKKTVFHCSLNPHPDDRLTTDQLQDIAREYMEKMGYGKQPYIVFKHNDIAREHIHIVSLRVDSYGKKLPYKFEARRSKRITDELERKYGLIPSGNRRSRHETHAENVLKTADVKQGDVRRQIAAVVRAVLKRYAFRSLGEMNLLLARYRIVAEEVCKEYKGKRYDGLVYAITDDAGEKRMIPLHAGKTGRGAGYAAVARHFEKSKALIKEKAPMLRNAIVEVMQSSPDKERFSEEMKKRGIDVHIRQNEQGRIYGITFISDEAGIAANGSRLGKGYSAHVFNDYFLGGKNPFLDYRRQEIRELPTVRSAPEMLPEAETGDDCYDEPVGTDELGIIVHGIDYKELAFQRKLRNRRHKQDITGKRRT